MSQIVDFYYYAVDKATIKTIVGIFCGLLDTAFQKLLHWVASRPPAELDQSNNWILPLESGSKHAYLCEYILKSSFHATNKVVFWVT